MYKYINIYTYIHIEIYKYVYNYIQVSDALGLPDIKNRQWSIQETSALKGAGLFEGFDW
jgi:ADP-ribosylation factor-like protein 1